MGMVRRLGPAVLMAYALAQGVASAAAPTSAPPVAADPWAPFHSPEFTHFPDGLRLPSDVVTSLAQSRDGPIWFGTLGGLVRFDGYRAQIYRGAADMRAVLSGPGPAASATSSPLSPVLPDAYVRSLLVLADGTLLVGTNSGGLVRFDPDANGFRPVPIFRREVAVRITALAPARDGGAWVVSDRGLDHYDPRGGAVTPLPMGDVDGVGARLFSVLEDSHGTLWVGGHPGLFRRAAGEAGFSRIAADDGDKPLQGALNDDVWSLYQDSAGRLWVGTGETGAYVLDPETGRPQAIPGLTGLDGAVNHHTVRAIIEAPDGDGSGKAGGPIWLATDGLGILTYDPAAHVLGGLVHSQTAATSLAGDTVRALMRDRTGNLWAGTQRGVDRVDPARRAVITVQAAPPGGVGLADPDVHAVTVDQRNRIWLGLARGLIDVLDPAVGTVRHLQLPAAQRGRDVFSLATAPDGAMLAGGRGVARIDADSLVVTPSWIPALDGTLILAIASAGDWVLLGGYDGLYIRRPDGTVTRLTHDPDDPASLPSDQIDDVLVQPPGGIWLGKTGAKDEAGPVGGRVWVGTAGGLAVADLADLPRLRFQTLRRVGRDGVPLPHNVINDIDVDGNGNLWAGTFGGGIAVLSADQVRDALSSGKGKGLGATVPLVIDELQGLANNEVSSLVVDSGGGIWASSAANLVHFPNPGFPPRVLGARDGVLVRSFNGRAAACGPNGEMLFGGLGGLTVVRPSLLTPAVPVGVLAVTALDVNHMSLPPGRLPAPGRTLTLGAGVKTIRMSLSLLDFRAPHDTRYAYRLDGFDEDWVEVTGAQPQAVYTNLPQGDYTFRVRAWTDLPGLVLSTTRDGVADADLDAEVDTATAPPPAPTRAEDMAQALSIAPMAELAFHVRVLPHWYEQAWFRLLMGFAVLALVACILAVRTEAQARRERALAQVVAARTRDLRAANTKLEQLASTDPLTGILNRRRFFELATLECGRARRYGRPFSVILFDLDHFKRVNDTFGHLMGDEVLRAAVAVAGKACRAVDLLARFGGEEVMLLLPETDAEGAQVVAERIRIALAETEVRYEDQVAQVTASLGVAQWRLPDETLESLLARADGALYQAKKGGRNRTVLAYQELERAARMGWAIVPSSPDPTESAAVPGDHGLVIPGGPDPLGPDPVAGQPESPSMLEPLARLAGLAGDSWIDPYERAAYSRPAVPPPTQKLDKESEESEG
ncbi:MAG: diguanylate cyclase [Azospirillaceae bacterium]|nr:diguanylate cyclase [Azospirillaceae bacterium]